MGRHRADGIPKYVFYAGNTLFLCAGIVLLAIGVEYKWFLDDFEPLHPAQQYYLNIAPSGAIVIGAAISFISLIGYWGAWAESNFLLSAYFMFHLTIFISQITLGSMGIVQARNSDGALGEKVAHTTAKLFDKYYEDEGARSLIDYLQWQLQCCGVEGPSYWNGTIPSSCCTCNCESCAKDAAFRQGCDDGVLYGYQKSIRVAGGILIGLAFFEIVGMTFSCWLIQIITSNKKFYDRSPMDEEE